MREINPTAMMIYIGEGAGGCTVDEKFFETAIVVPDSEFQKRGQGNIDLHIASMTAWC